MPTVATILSVNLNALAFEIKYFLFKKVQSENVNIIIIHF